MDTIINTYIQSLTMIPVILTGSMSLYILPTTIKNFFQKNKNKTRNWKLYKLIPDINHENCPTIHKAYISQKSLNTLKKIFEQAKYPEELKEIVQIFKNKVSEENFYITMKNLQTIRINTIEKDLKYYLQNIITDSTMQAGNYNPYNNTITLFHKKKDILSHEFLHMASTRDKYRCGFNLQTRFNQEIGRGLNEGYTELLNKRIFNSKSFSYFHNVKIARLIETFFDNPKDMENAYFNGNLEEILKQFLNYGTKEEFFQIMNSLDNLATTTSFIFNQFETIKTELNLYKIIKRSKDQNKINNFEQILNENKLIKLLKSKKFTLIKQTTKSKTR